MEDKIKKFYKELDNFESMLKEREKSIKAKLALKEFFKIIKKLHKNSFK